MQPRLKNLQRLALKKAPQNRLMIFKVGPLQTKGFVRKLHGFDGGLKLVILEHAQLQKKEPVFFLLDGKPVPFFLCTVEGSDEEPIIHLEDIHSEDDARIFLGKELLQQSEKEAMIPDFFDGWLIMHNGIPLGKISQVIQRPHQLLLEISSADRVYLIPFVEEWVLGLDEDQKTIDMQLPEGLLDINE